MNSSQESLSLSQETVGPLSQETLAKVLNGIPKEIFDSFMKSNFEGNLSSGEDNAEDFPDLSDPNQFNAIMNPLQLPNIGGSHMQSSIPAIENLPGFFDFTLLPFPEVSSKSCNYTYSSVTHKLYVKEDIPCPFTFSTNQRLDGFVLRAMLYFTSPENRTKVVECCLRHQGKSKERGDVNYEHFIQSSSKSASYVGDSGRLSVAVNYENPENGESSSTYLFKFTCLSSCYGGANRRLMCIVFTLEKGEAFPVFGRCKVDLKVCTSPYRDKTNEEKIYKEKNPSFPTSNTPQSLNNIMKNDENVLNQFKRKRVKPSDEEHCFYLKAKDKEEYNFLRSVQRYYHMRTLVNTYKWKPTISDMQQVLRVLSSNSSEEE